MQEIRHMLDEKLAKAIPVEDLEAVRKSIAEQLAEAMRTERAREPSPHLGRLHSSGLNRAQRRALQRQLRRQGLMNPALVSDG